MNPAVTIFVVLLFINGEFSKKESHSKDSKIVSTKKASAFLGFKDCMKAMNCGPALKKECVHECKKGNTKEEVEEHVEKLRKVQKYAKDAKDAKRMSKRQDTDLSDTDSDTDSDDDSTSSSENEGYCRLGNKCQGLQKANRFLSYRDCMKRMNCGKAVKNECKEECLEGNTEEEVEEHGSFLRKIDKYIAEAKRLKSTLHQKDSDDSTSSSDSDDSTDDTDKDSTDSDTDTDSDKK
ncbi:hypothetical protein ACOME3_003621 [Neoechinorhynchus agilis]